SVAFAPDGRTALSGGHDKALRLWDLATGKEIRTFTGHSGYINSVAYSPDGRTALSGGRDKALRLWDLATGKEIRTFAGNFAAVSSVAFAPDGRTALSASFRSDTPSGEDDTTSYAVFMTTLKLWDVATGTEIRTFGQSSSVAFSPDGRTALS